MQRDYRPRDYRQIDLHLTDRFTSPSSSQRTASASVHDIPLQNGSPISKWMLAREARLLCTPLNILRRLNARIACGLLVCQAIQPVIHSPMERTCMLTSFDGLQHGPEHEEDHDDHWCPKLDRRAALRLLGMSSVAAATGCASSAVMAVTASTSASTATATTTSLAAASATATQNANVTLTASVVPAVASGTVTFYDGTTALGNATLRSGQATLASAFTSTGTHAVTAVYAGSTTYVTSTSPAVSITVSASTAACTTTLEGEEGPYFVDDSVTGYFRGNIVANLDGTSMQTGVPLTLTVNVFDSKNSCAAMQSVQVISGTAMPLACTRRRAPSLQWAKAGCVATRLPTPTAKSAFKRLCPAGTRGALHTFTCASAQPTIRVQIAEPTPFSCSSIKRLLTLLRAPSRPTRLRE